MIQRYSHIVTFTRHSTPFLIVFLVVALARTWQTNLLPVTQRQWKKQPRRKMMALETKLPWKRRQRRRHHVVVAAVVVEVNRPKAPKGGRGLAHALDLAPLGEDPLLRKEENVARYDLTF